MSAVEEPAAVKKEEPTPPAPGPMVTEAEPEPDTAEEEGKAAAVAKLEADRIAALTEELSGLKMRALIKRAEALNIPEAAIDEAGDADDDRAAITKLILDCPPEGIPPEDTLGKIAHTLEQAGDAAAKWADEHHIQEKAGAAAAAVAEGAQKAATAVADGAKAAGEAVDPYATKASEALHLGEASDAIVSAAIDAADVVRKKAVEHGIGGVSDHATGDTARDKEFVVDESIANVGVLTVTVLSGKGLTSKDRVGKSDPYVIARAGNANTAATGTVYNTLTPTWPAGEGTLGLNVQSVEDVVVVECYDCDHKGTDKTTGAGRVKDDTMGVASLTVKELIAAGGPAGAQLEPMEVPLFDPTATKEAKKDAGSLSLTATWEPI